jgi:hypothetical protein
MLEATSSITCTLGRDLDVGGLTKVAWLDTLDLVDSLDLSSWRELDRSRPDALDLGNSEPSSRNFGLEFLLGRFFSLDKSVSGGLGGRASLREDFSLSFDPLADVDRLLFSEPKSVASGVSGSAWRAEVPKSSRLWTASLL